MKSENDEGQTFAKAIDALLDHVKQHDWKISWSTADELAEIGEPAVPRLISALTDEDGYVRDVAAIALGKIGDARAVEPLISAMRHKDNRSYDDDEDREARMSAATALGKIADPKSLMPLIETLQGTLVNDDNVSWYIMEALGRLGDKRAIPVLENALEHWDPDVRQEATKALRRIKQCGE